jgi:phospholipase/lecithinase/hemolysin
MAPSDLGNRPRNRSAHAMIRSLGPKLIAALRPAACLIALAASSVAIAAPFSDIVVFGDSLSDVGNVASASLGIFPGSAYYNNRFSNGPVWVETLSAGLGLGVMQRSTSGGDNFAYGGAKTSGTGGLEGIFIRDLNEQVSQFLNSRTANASTLYVVYAGANDYIQGQTNASIPVGRITTDLNRLIAAGARQFLVPNLPLLGSTPRFNDSPATAATYSLRAEQFNAALNASLDGLEAGNVSLAFHRLDVASLFAEAIAKPAEFGLINVVDPAAPGLEAGAGSYDRSQIAPNANQYLFWDDLHPTGTVHAILGNRALALVDGIAGDFNADGLINAADLAAWQQNVGTAAAARRTQGDADNDRDVDGSDFLAWQLHLGTFRPTASTTAVPEPALATFVIVAIMAASMFARTRGSQMPRGTRRLAGCRTAGVYRPCPSCRLRSIASSARRM